MTVEFLTTGDLCRPETRVGSPRGFLYVTLFLSALVPTLFVMGYLAGFIGPKPGSLSDSDCYVYLLRVERLWQSGLWYDPILERSNAPHGEVLHWTRPFGVLLLLGGTAGSPFVGLRASLFWWGVILSPVLLGVTLGVLPWVLRPLVGRDGSFIVGLIFICQMGTWLVFQAGRPDHHGLLLLLFILVLGYMLRMVTLPLSASVCWGAGIIAALALWTSIESILMIGLSLFMLTALWVGRGGDFHRKILYYGVALQVIHQRRIDLILVAPGSERVRRFYCRQEAGSIFYQRLCDGQVPDWCRPVTLPAGLDSFRLFEIHLH